MWTGCGAARNQDGALDWWRKIIEPRVTQSRGLHVTSRSIYTKALSCLANAYYERSEISASELQIDDLYRAGKLAAACASKGFVAPVVLVIANRIDKLGLRNQVDNQFPKVHVARFGALEPLWEVFDRRTAELNERDEKENFGMREIKMDDGGGELGMRAGGEDRVT